MIINQKNQEEILQKLGIQELNPMQTETLLAFESNPEIVLLSPTGTGKTLAFLLPLLKNLRTDCHEIQVLILVPTRELAMQIEQVFRQMGSGFKANAVYGGRAGLKDKIDLKHRPAVLIGTPGRIADHFRNERFDTTHILSLVLDEFDKSLEIGFEKEMQEILALLPNLENRILTSATQKMQIPEFVGMKHPFKIDYTSESIAKLSVQTISSPSKDKLVTLKQTLHFLGAKPGIIFCNFKDSIQFVSEYLTENGIQHGLFHGDMEQKDREQSLIKFRNGSEHILLATDLAARGIDVPEIAYIIHYQLPPRKNEFIHRNGRTARMHQEGTAYVLHWEKETLPDFIESNIQLELKEAPLPTPSVWVTLIISGGRRDKISKGDVIGLFIKQGNIQNDQIGIIELKQDTAYVAVHKSIAKQLMQKVNNQKLKKKKIRVSLLK